MPRESNNFSAAFAKPVGTKVDAEMARIELEKAKVRACVHVCVRARARVF